MRALRLRSNRTISLEQVLKALRQKKWRVYSDKDFQLNIVGIRRQPFRVNEFHDTLFCFHTLEGQWTYQKYQITTIPGLTYLSEKFYNKKGTAILVPGQYRDTYEIALHRGEYPALCQKKGVPVKAYRDDRLDGIPKLDPSKIDPGTGAINIHRSSEEGCSINVGEYSAGCQVFRCGEHFQGFMALVYKAAELHGNSFTYTLLDQKDVCPAK